MPDATKRDPQEVAEEAARLVLAHDRSTFSFLGFALVEIGPGRAVLRFTVAPHHLNSAGVCHGGIVFALADSALGSASCSHGIQTLAQTSDRYRGGGTGTGLSRVDGVRVGRLDAGSTRGLGDGGVSPRVGGRDGAR